MEKRLIMAIVFSMAVLFAYPYVANYINPPKPKKAVETVVPSEQKAVTEAPKKEEPKKPVKEDLTIVETPLYKAVFTNVGGAIRSFELKKYSVEMGKASPGISLNETIAKNKSFKTLIDANGLREEVIFTPSSASLTVAESGTGELVYTGSSSTGLKIEKRYGFSADTYFIETEIKATNAASTHFSGLAVVALNSGKAGKDADGYHTGPIIRTKDKLIRQADDEASKTGVGPIKWMGLEDKYFLSALIPVTDGQVSWKAEVASITDARAELQLPLTLAQGATQAYKYKTFVGPKEYDMMVNQKNDLEESIEFGWFDFMAKPFLVVLNFFQRYIGNYGIAIILLTVIIKVIFYPLTKKSMQSMNEMKKMQPQMAALKEKYKDNKDKMNKEMMDLYKRYKVNPLGGCLPMLLQIPVFIALYEVLYVAIELRHAPFFFWIQDLASKDPYYITPLLMGATMFIQQKMTPTSVDPTQAKIMLIMPVVFTFMFLNFPAGLVIYWLVNNVLSIIQQYYIQKAPVKA